VAKTALLFPGQGAQSVGMGVGLRERSIRARELFSQASDILGYDLSKLCAEGPDSTLALTVHSQPALFVHSVAALEDFFHQRPEVRASVALVAGLSLGEYSALVAAGSLSFEDGVRLVAARGRAMQQAASAVPSGMASILGLDREQVDTLCDASRESGEILQVANLLCPGNIAVSGHAASLARCEQNASAAEAKFIHLNVAGAFHTDIMSPAVASLTEAIEQSRICDAAIPLVSNVDAVPHQSADEFARLLTRQIVSPVQWEASLRRMISDGIEQFYEIGVGRVLTGTLKRTDRKIPCEAFGD
jgi:[acyl-carrier-protein] S-malonyltransferase